MKDVECQFCACWRSGKAWADARSLSGASSKCLYFRERKIKERSLKRMGVGGKLKSLPAVLGFGSDPGIPLVY